MSEERIDVLFVCIHNAGRSVAAKVIFNDLAEKLGLGLRSQSAGTDPGEHVNPSVRRVLESFNLDVSHEIPRLMTEEMLADGPHMVTMGCSVGTEACPGIEFAEADDWGLCDPAEMSNDEEVVSLVHEISRRVNVLIRELSAGESG